MLSFVFRWSLEDASRVNKCARDPVGGSCGATNPLLSSIPLESNSVPNFSDTFAGIHSVWFTYVLVSQEKNYFSSSYRRDNEKTSRQIIILDTLNYIGNSDRKITRPWKVKLSGCVGRPHFLGIVGTSTIAAPPLPPPSSRKQKG